MWDPRGRSCDSQVEAATVAARAWEPHVSIGLFALWVGWPAGLALYAGGRAARVMRRDEMELLPASAAGAELGRSPA
jgi:hypothetical protein